MEEILKQWSGDAFSLAPYTYNATSLTSRDYRSTRGAALIQSSNPLLPEVTEIAGGPSTRRARQLSRLDIPSGAAAAAGEIEFQLNGDQGGEGTWPLCEDLGQQAGRGDREGVRGWAPRGSASSLRSSMAASPSRSGKQTTVSFANHSGERPESRPSSCAPTPWQSIDGVSYDDTEVEQLDVMESCCAPHAAEHPLAVSNCHMLKFLAAFGTLQGRKEDGVAPRRRRSRKFPRASSLSAGNSSESPASLTAGLRSGSSDQSGSRRPSLLGAPDQKLPALPQTKPRGMLADASRGCVHVICVGSTC